MRETNRDITKKIKQSHVMASHYLYKLDEVVSEYSKYVGYLCLLRHVFRCMYLGGSAPWEYSIEKTLDTLKSKEREVLSLRFGLRDGKSLSLEDTSKLFGVSRERVRQIEAKALRKLQAPTRRRMLLGNTWQSALKEVKAMGAELLAKHNLKRVQRKKTSIREDTIQLPTRTINALKIGGYRSIEDLRKATDKELLKCKNIGTIGVMGIRVALLKIDRQGGEKI